ncbi:MMPL family transporter, partial [Cryptosporangium phraense]
MLDRLGRAMFRHRWWAVAAAVAVIAVGGAWGTQIFGAVVTGGFDDPSSESSRATARADAELGRDDADVVVLYRSHTATVDDPSFASAVNGTLAKLPGGAVVRSATYWNTQSPALVGLDRRETYVALTLSGDDQARRIERLDELRDDLDAPGLETRIGGTTAVSRDINDRVAADIARAETLSMPVLLVLLVIIFGSLAAASLPLAVGGLAILGAFTALRGLSYVTDVSVFSVNVVTILGLGLAIDYGLFMVGRFREELSGGLSTEDAVARTMATAGRTVAFSGVTVALSLSGLLLFPLTFLRSMGFGGLAAVLIAVASALTVLPALLSILGPRIDAFPVRRTRTSATGHGFWYRLAHSIMRRPVVYAVGVLAVLLLAGAPFLRVEFGGIDARALPSGTESRVVSETLDRDFVRNGQSPI